MGVLLDQDSSDLSLLLQLAWTSLLSSNPQTGVFIWTSPAPTCLWAAVSCPTAAWSVSLPSVERLKILGAKVPSSVRTATWKVLLSSWEKVIVTLLLLLLSLLCLTTRCCFWLLDSVAHLQFTHFYVPIPIQRYLAWSFPVPVLAWVSGQVSLTPSTAGSVDRQKLLASKGLKVNVSYAHRE